MPPDCNVLYAWPQTYMETWLGHERRVYYDRNDFKKILEQHGLTPHGVHVFVEGASDAELIGGLISAIWGSYRELGVRFTTLEGLGNVPRYQALFDTFSTYARKAILVADAEGKVERDLQRLRSAGLLVEDDEFPRLGSKPRGRQRQPQRADWLRKEPRCAKRNDEAGLNPGQAQGDHEGERV